MNAYLFEPEYFPFKCIFSTFLSRLLRISYLAGKFNQKRDVIKPNRKPKYRTKCSDTFHEINPLQPQGFLLPTLSSVIFRKVGYIYCLASPFFDILFCTFFFILAMAGTVGSIFEGCLCSWIIMHFFTIGILYRFTATFFWRKYVCSNRRTQVFVLYSKINRP